MNTSARDRFVAFAFCWADMLVELDPTRTIIATEILKEIRARLGFLMNVGLDYLTLARTAISGSYVF